MVDPDAVAAEVSEVATEAAPHVEGEAEVEASDVPSVRRLDVEHASDPAGLQAAQPAGVGRRFGRRVLAATGFGTTVVGGHRNHRQWASMVPTTTVNDVSPATQSNADPDPVARERGDDGDHERHEAQAVARLGAGEHVRQPDVQEDERGRADQGRDHADPARTRSESVSRRATRRAATSTAPANRNVMNVRASNTYVDVKRTGS